MKNHLKLVLAVFVFTSTCLISVHNSYAKQGLTSATGSCTPSDKDCGVDMKGNQICGTLKGDC